MISSLCSSLPFEGSFSSFSSLSSSSLSLSLSPSSSVSGLLCESSSWELSSKLSSWGFVFFFWLSSSFSSTFLDFPSASLSINARIMAFWWPSFFVAFSRATYSFAFSSTFLSSFLSSSLSSSLSSLSFFLSSLASSLSSLSSFSL